MKKNRKKTIVLLLLGFGLATAQAQEATTGTGGNASGSGGTVAYSVGQIVYTTNTGATGSVAQGVQQPYEISITYVLEDNQISLNMLTYPNPTTEYLTLNVGASTSLSNQTMTYELCDMSGKLIESKKIISTTETIRMENLPRATYFLKLTDNSKEVKIFKIIKN